MGVIYELTYAGINQAVGETERYLQERGIERKDILRLRLMLEEALLQFRDKFGELQFSLNKRNILGRVRITASVRGESFDPFATDDENAALLRRLHADDDNAANWTYQGGANVVSFAAQRKLKISMSQQTLLVIALAVLIGIACGAAPETARKSLLESFVTPTLGVIMGVISAVAGPMVFLSLLWSVSTIGDVQTLSKIGNRMIRRFLLGLLICASAIAALSFPFYADASEGGAAFRLWDFYELLLGIIPNNVVTPFINGNTQQLIFLSVVFGVVILLLGDRVAAFATLIDQLNLFIQNVMKLANRLIPFIVFFGVLKMSLEGQFSVIGRVYKLLVAFLVAHVILFVGFTILTSVSQKVKASLLVKKAMPTFLRGLTTASSAAAMQTNIETCENDFGIDKKIVSFGVPLGQTVFMPSVAVTFVCVGFGMAELYDVPVTPQWAFVCVIISVLLAASAPPVAGGSAVCYAILFRQLGIPEEGISLALAFGMLAEYVETAVNLYGLQMELTNLAGSLDMLDRDALRRETRT